MTLPRENNSPDPAQFIQLAKQIRESHHAFTSLIHSVDVASTLRDMLTSEDPILIDGALVLTELMSPKRIEELITELSHLTLIRRFHSKAVKILACLHARKLRRTLMAFMLEALIDSQQPASHERWQLAADTFTYLGFKDALTVVANLALGNEQEQVREFGRGIVSELATQTGSSQLRV